MSWSDNKPTSPSPRGTDKATGVAVLIGIVLWIITIIISLATGWTFTEPASASESNSTSYTDALVERTTDHFSVRDSATTCAATESEWEKSLVDAGFPPNDQGVYHFAFSYPLAGTVYYSPYVCVGIRKGLVANYRRLNPLRVAWAVDVLVHEAMHVRLSSANEQQAEACAAKYLAYALNRLYKIKYRTPEMRLLTLLALAKRRTLQPHYLNGRCPV